MLFGGGGIGLFQQTADDDPYPLVLKIPSLPREQSTSLLLARAIDLIKLPDLEGCCLNADRRLGCRNSKSGAASEQTLAT